MPDEIGVLIVGAGPTGLTLGIELARRRIPFQLIDRDPERPTSSRAIGTQARTVEVFQLMGIPEAALVPAARPRALRFAERDRTLGRIVFAEAMPGGPGLISMDESDTERVLEERLAALGGSVSRGRELLGFRLDGDDVVATVRSADGEAAVRARYLVGTDGAHSTVRREAGIAFVGEAYPERFLLADLDLRWDLPHDEAHVWFDEAGLVAAIPLPGERRFRVIVPLPPAESEVEFPSDSAVAARAEALLRQRTGVPLSTIGAPIWASSFRISRRQAERYRAGSVFLAGDAAHVHSPVGGQGMNTGIQDAFNLGWKLSLAVRQEAAPGLLDTYEAERHPVAAGVLRGTHLGTRLVLASNPVAQAFREYAIPALTGFPPARHRLIEAISQVRVGYRDSFLAVDAGQARPPRRHLRRGRGGLRAGDRVPDRALRRVPGGEPTTLYSLIANGWTLLLVAGKAATPARLAALEDLARQTRSIVGNAVQTVIVADAPPPAPPMLPLLIDPQGEIRRLFGVDKGLAALLRPDGYLGYRGGLEQTGALASYLARVFAMTMPGLDAAGDAPTVDGP